MTVASVSEDSEDSDLEDDCIDISVTSFEEYATSARFTFQLSPPSQVSSLPPSNLHQPSAYGPQPSPTPADDSTHSQKSSTELMTHSATELTTQSEKSPAKLAKDDRLSINAFFMKITPEQKAENDKHDFEELSAKQEENQAMKKKHKRQKLLDKREKAKDRQQAFRDREKAKKEAAGEISQRGKVSDDDKQTEWSLTPYAEAKASRLRWSRQQPKSGRSFTSSS